MGIEIKTDVAFERRLAELAWENADELVKASITNSIALNFRSQSEYMDGLSEQIADNLLQTAINTVLESTDIEGAIDAAIARAKNRLEDDDFLEQLLREHVAAAKKHFTKVIMEVVGRTAAPSPRIIEDITRDAIRDGVASALLATIEPLRSGVNTEMFNEISRALKRVELVANKADTRDVYRKIVKRVQGAFSNSKTEDA